MNHTTKKSRISIYLTSRNLHWRKWIFGHAVEGAAAALEFTFLAHMSFFASPLLCSVIGGLLGHPQCLDYRLPFQPPFHLEFCSAYENFGCCDQERDNSIAAKYGDIMDYIDPRGHKLCGMYIKDILCQVGQKNSTCILCFGLTWGSTVVLIASYS